MSLRKHAHKIVLGLLALLLVATLWLGADWLARIEALSNGVRVEAATLQGKLDSDDVNFARHVAQRFKPGTVYSAIQQNWEAGLPDTGYPESILEPPARAP